MASPRVALTMCCLGSAQCCGTTDDHSFWRLAAMEAWRSRAESASATRWVERSHGVWHKTAADLTYAPSMELADPRARVADGSRGHVFCWNSIATERQDGQASMVYRWQCRLATTWLGIEDKAWPLHECYCKNPTP